MAESLIIFIKYSMLPMAIYDKDMRLIAQSDSWKAMYGTDDGIIGEIHYDVFPDLPLHWKIAHQNALNGTISEYVEEPYTLANGPRGWRQWQCQPWRDLHGEVAGIVISSEDTTQKKRQEIEIRRVLSRFELVQQAAHIGVWDWDIAQKSITLNAEYYEILGLPIGYSVSYQDFQDLIHEDDLSRVREAMGKALIGESDYEAEFRIYRKSDATMRWVKDKGHIEISEDGAPIRGYGAIIDVT